MKILMRDAVAAFRAGNNAGTGFTVGNVSRETIDDAVEYYRECGAKVLLERATSDDVALVRTREDALVAIGGDARGHGAWCVDITMRVRARVVAS
jgi:hypothetical protein